MSKLSFNFRKNTLNEKGMSIPIVMALGTTIAVLSTYYMKVIDVERKSIARSNENLDIKRTVEQIESQLRDRDVCDASLFGKKTNHPVTDAAPITNLRKVFYPDPTDFSVSSYVDAFKISSLSSTTYGSSGIKIESYELREPAPILGSYGITELIVTFKRKASGVGMSTFEKRIPISVHLQNGVSPRTIETCRVDAPPTKIYGGDHILEIHSNDKHMPCPDGFNDTIGNYPYNSSIFQYGPSKETNHYVTSCYGAAGRCYVLYLYGKFDVNTGKPLGTSNGKFCPPGWTLYQVPNRYGGQFDFWFSKKPMDKYQQTIQSCYICPEP